MIPEIDIPEVNLDTLADRLAAGDALVVDVRETEEYRPGHVPGARNLPLSTLPATIGALPRDRAVYVICQSGRRSARATALMRAAGIDAANVAGGTGGWIAAGRPVEAA